MFSILKWISWTNSFKGFRLITGLRSPVFLGTRKMFERNSSFECWATVIAPFSNKLSISRWIKLHSPSDREGCNGGEIWLGFVLNSRRYARTDSRIQGSVVILDHSSTLVASLPPQDLKILTSLNGFAADLVLLTFLAGCDTVFAGMACWSCRNCAESCSGCLWIKKNHELWMCYGGI